MNDRAATPYWTVPTPGETIAGRYLVESTCGRGSSAIVLIAADAERAERVAVKVLLPDSAGDAKAVERFLGEARAAERIESEHVARVLDMGTMDCGAPYVVNEYLEGDSLKEVLAKWQPLPVATAVDWLVQACEAVGEAHVNGLVHGDLKPSNLVLAPRLRPGGVVSIKVIDFGLSKPSDVPTAIAGQRLTGMADVMGSPHYMAPEQLRASRETNPRTDIWALGAVLCEVLTGEPPFVGDTLPQVCAAVLTKPPRDLKSLRSDVPRELELCIVRCLEKDPAARFASVLELSRALAPFGSPIARVSLARLERVCSAAKLSGHSLQRSPLASEGEPPLPELPSEVYALPRRGGASAPVIFGSLLMLTALGAGAFLAMYGSVHGGTSARAEAPLGLTAGQGTTGVVELSSSSSPLPVPPTAPDPLATTSPFAVVPNAPPAPAAPPELPDVSDGAPAGGTPGAATAVDPTTGAASHVQHSPQPARAPVRRAVVHNASRPAPQPPSGIVAAPVSAQPRGNSRSSVTPDVVPATTRGEPGSDPAKIDSNPYEQPQEGPASQAQVPVADPFDNRK